MAKRKTQLDNLCALLRASAAGSAAFLLSYPAAIFCFGSLASLLSCLGSFTCLLPLLAYPRTFTTLLFCLVSASVPRSLAVLLPFFVLGPIPLYLTSITRKTFKQALSDKALCHSTSFAKLFCPFLPLGLLPNKTDYKRTFDKAFINSCPVAGNYVWEEVDWSFLKCGFPATTKLNRSWQLELLNFKPICIMESMPHTAAIIWNLSFLLGYRHNVKLTFKLGLRTQGIASDVFKERIELV